MSDDSTALRLVLLRARLRQLRAQGDISEDDFAAVVSVLEVYEESLLGPLLEDPELAEQRWQMVQRELRHISEASEVQGGVLDRILEAAAPEPPKPPVTETQRPEPAPAPTAPPQPVSEPPAP